MAHAHLPPTTVQSLTPYLPATISRKVVVSKRIAQSYEIFTIPVFVPRPVANRFATLVLISSKGVPATSCLAPCVGLAACNKVGAQSDFPWMVPTHPRSATFGLSLFKPFSAVLIIDYKSTVTS